MATRHVENVRHVSDSSKLSQRVRPIKNGPRLDRQGFPRIARQAAPVMAGANVAIVIIYKIIRSAPYRDSLAAGVTVALAP